MSKIRKILTLAACAVLLVCVTIAGTVAYLTSQDTVENTFTVGNVKITLDETDVNLNGVQDGTTRVKENEYKLMPGHTYIKDPIVHIDDASEEAYLYVVVKFEGGKAADDLGLPMLSIFKTIDENAWTISDKAIVGNDVYYMLTYDTIITGQTADITLFSEMVVPGNLTNEQVAQLAGIKMNITAYAVQKDGFNDSATAWDKTFKSTYTNAGVDFQ